MVDTKFIYPAIFTPDEEEGGYTVEVPDLPGCITEGDTLLEAIEMAVDAASGWILVELEEGNDFPKPTKNTSEFKLEKNSFINLIVLDINAYSEKHGKKAVRKNISIPAYLNTYVEKNNINCSHVLQEALMNLSNGNK